MTSENTKKIKKGDQVLIIAGNYKGKRGEVLKMFPKTDRAIVSDVNVVSKHLKPSANNPEGGITKKEMPIHISNVRKLIEDKKNTKKEEVAEN